MVYLQARKRADFRRVFLGERTWINVEVEKADDGGSERVRLR